MSAFRRTPTSARVRPLHSSFCQTEWSQSVSDAQLLASDATDESRELAPPLEVTAPRPRELTEGLRKRPLESERERDAEALTFPSSVDEA